MRNSNRRYLKVLKLLAVLLAGTGGGIALGQGYGQGGMRCPTEQREVIQTAVLKGDYEAWKATVEKSGCGWRVLQVINANNFPRFVEMHKLMLAGKYDEARAIRAELGLGQGPGQGPGQGRGRGRW